MNDWIDVNHRLPELNPRDIRETVLVFVVGKVEDTRQNPFAGAKLFCGSWSTPDGRPLGIEVTHWCAMPSACRLVWGQGEILAVPCSDVA